MKAKKRTIYNNYDLWGMEDDARERLIDDGIENPTENQISDMLHEMDSWSWGDETSAMASFMKNKTFIAFGTIGTWQGQLEGGVVIHRFNDLYKLWNDCDYIKIYDENGHLHIECSHHDGTNHYELRELNERGVAYEYSHRSWLDRRTMINRLRQTNYSRLPHYLHKVYGCKKVEYEKEVA